MERRNLVLRFLCNTGSRWLPAWAETTPLATSYAPTLCCSSSSPQLSHFSKHIAGGEPGEIRHRIAYPLHRMAWGVTWGVFPLLSSCLLIRVKDFSGRTVPKDVVVNHGRNGWSRAFNLLLLKRKQANCFYWTSAITQTWHKSSVRTFTLQHEFAPAVLVQDGRPRAFESCTVRECMPDFACRLCLILQMFDSPGEWWVLARRQLGSEPGERCTLCKKDCSHVWLLLLGAAMTENCSDALGETFYEMGMEHCLTKQGYRLPSIPLRWQLNKPLSHLWLCLKKLVWFRMIWVEENTPLKDPAWAPQCVEGGRGEFPSPSAKVNSAQKEEIRARCSHLRAFHQPKWKIN